jgi:hypothetical protein
MRSAFGLSVASALGLMVVCAGPDPGNSRAELRAALGAV